MDYFHKEPSEKPKSRKWLGCLIGCLVVFAFFILFFIFLAWLLFRARPPVPEDRFFSPEVSGFARFQVDALQQEPAKELLINLIKESSSPSENQQDQEINPEGLWAAFDLILHKRHYVYFYQGEDENLEFLLVIGLKRFHWIVRSFLKGSKAEGFQELTLPKGEKGRLFKLENDKGDKFVAITNVAFFASNSEDRIRNALILVRSKTPSQNLDPSVENLLPPDNPDDMFNGALLWKGEFTDDIYNRVIEKNKELEKLIDPIYQILSEETIDGAQVRCGLSSPDLLKITLQIRCLDESRASFLAKSLTKALSHEEIPESIEKTCSSSGNMVQIELLIPGVETWLKDRFKEN
ncbi:hypothetical protein JW926_02585 [Candidatus Sumerlaeota bacterium]|nr:hypothetical protein [Candidatus Sumerlaeota bacterium]